MTDIDKIRHALEMARDFHDKDSKMYALLSDAINDAPGVAQSAPEPAAWQVQGKNGDWQHIPTVLVGSFRDAGNKVRPLYAAQPPAAPVVSQHIGWLKQYAAGMNENNWLDMRGLIQRQLVELCAALAPAAPVETGVSYEAMNAALALGRPGIERMVDAIAKETGEKISSRSSAEPAAPVETRDRKLLATLVYEAMRFSIWAAGQGLMAQEGEPTRDPEDFLFEYSQALDIDDWDGLAEVARDAILAQPANSSAETSGQEG